MELSLHADAALPDIEATARPSRFGDCLLAIGVLLTTASQFRLSGLPVGIGELCLLAWLVYRLPIGLRDNPQLTPSLSRLIIFWASVALSQSLGFLAGLSLNFGYDPVWLLHDVLAYPLLAAVTCLSVLGPGAQVRQNRVCWLLVTLGGLALAVQIAAGWGVIDIPGFQPWFWERFRGWSSNPNQLALLCGVLGTLSLHLAETAERARGRFLAAASAIPAILAGRMTGSDTFSMVLVAAGPIYIGLKLGAVLVRRQPSRFVSTAFLQIVLLSLPLALASLVPLAIVSPPGALLGQFAKNGGKDVGEELDLRLMLWQQAIEVGLRSGMLGVGPGPHLEIPASIVAARRATVDQPENLDHPQQQISAPNFEAHNSFFDLLTQGGLHRRPQLRLDPAGRGPSSLQSPETRTSDCAFVSWNILPYRIVHPASDILVRHNCLPGAGEEARSRALSITGRAGFRVAGPGRGRGDQRCSGGLGANRKSLERNPLHGDAEL